MEFLGTMVLNFHQVLKFICSLIQERILLELYFSVWQRVHPQLYIARHVTKTFGKKLVIYRRLHTDMHIGKMLGFILFILAMFYYLLTCFLDFYI